MNTKGQTLLEVTVASILAMIIMTASVSVIQVAQREIGRFKTQIDNDTTWMTANTHLARTVRSSSYLEVSRDGNTLTLHNYDESEEGRYVNNAAENSIDYLVNEGRTLAERYRNTRATFSIVPDRKRENRDIEVRIDYASPFVNMLCLRCGAGVSAETSPTWARLISAGWSGPNGVAATPILNRSGGRIIGYAVVAGWNATTMLYAIDTDGNAMASIPAQHYGGMGIHSPESIMQTFDSQIGGNFTGFIVSGDIDPYSSTRSYIIKLGINGSPEWLRGSSASGFGGRFQNATQIFNATGGPDGYALTVGFASSGMFFYRVNNSGNLVRQIRIGRSGFWHALTLTIPVLSKSGSSDGFLELSLTRPDSASISESNYYFTRIRETAVTPFIIYDKDFMENINKSPLLRGHSLNYYHYTGFGSLKQVVNDKLEPDGFLATMYSDKLGCTILIKIKSDGNIEWSRTFDGLFTLSNGPISQTFSQQYGGVPTGYIIALENSYCFPSIIKLNNDGEIEWQKTGFARRANGSLTIMQNFDAQGFPDGYIYVSDASDAMRISGHRYASNCIYVVKMDNFGRCPEIKDPEAIDLGWEYGSLFMETRLSTDGTSSAGFVEDTTDYVP